jgi:hypothetical protein
MTLAHAGHWLVNMLYAAPLIAVIAIIVRDRIRQRREAAPAADEGGGGLEETLDDASPT